MDIAQLSTAMASSRINQQIQIAVLDKTMDATKAEGASLIRMMDNSMELSVNPHIGSNFDMMV